MLRPMVVGALMLVPLASCDQIKNMRGVPALVREGNPQACIHPDTQALLERVIRRWESDEPIPAEEVAALPITVSNTTMTVIERGVSVTCTSDLSYPGWVTKVFEYRLIPTADGSDFQINWNVREHTAYELAKAKWEHERRATQTPQTPIPIQHNTPSNQPSATTDPNQKSALIRSFEAQAVANANSREARSAAANGETDPYRFTVSERAVKEGDLDGDGDQDFVALAVICEETNCHATTQSSVVGLFVNDNGKWRLASTRVLEGNGSIKRVSPAGAVIATLEFGPDDPDCCASQERTHTIRLGN